LRALVTGGAGFLGSALVERLVVEGHHVDVVDDLSRGSLARLAGARSGGERRLTFHQLDVSDPALGDLMGRTRPQVVYHLAGPSGTSGSVADPVADARAGILGTLHVLEACRASGVQKVVHAAGAAMYGHVEAADLPLRETRVMRPATPRAVADRAVTDYLWAYRELHSLEFTVLILGSVYGPGQAPPAVVAAFVASLRSGRTGTVLGDGASTRDFVFIDDAVDALVRAADRGGGLCLNVGTGVETSVIDLYRLVARLLGSDGPPLRGRPRLGERSRVRLDPSRASIHLGWRPWTTLEEGVRAVVRSGAP
jgi:UDP-glucose 4-epimerase